MFARYQQKCLQLSPIDTCLLLACGRKCGRKQECSRLLLSSYHCALTVSLSQFGENTLRRRKLLCPGGSLVHQQQQQSPNCSSVVSKRICNYVINSGIMASSHFRDSSFLAHKALPNILVYFVGIPSQVDQQSILKKISRAIDSLYGVDRYVVYQIQTDELTGDSRAYSASALLIVYNQSDKPRVKISQSTLPQVSLSLDQLCPDGSDEINREFFADQLQKYQIISKEELLTEVESTLHDDTAVYLLDSKRNYDTWLKMLDKQTNLIKYTHSDLPPRNFVANDVFFIDWQRDSPQVELEGFSVNRYFQNLETNYLGRSLVFADKVSTTMELITRFKQTNGAVALANYQTAGIGRNANRWLSPKGCAMFTISLQLSTSSSTIGRLPLIQHLASLAVVLALPAKELNVKIKWPNDILFGESMSKLAGILTRSYCYGNMINVQIGMGINVSNRQPSVCLDEVIQLYNSRSSDVGNSTTRLEAISREALIARILNNLERLLDMLSEGVDRLAEIKQMYTDNWVHSDARVLVHDNRSGKMEREMRICGINDDGYLLAEDVQSGELLSLKPDGNRFDLMHNLVILNA